MKVTVYGDSILKGVRLEDGRYVVDREWERRLGERFGADIRNRSRFGCTIRKALTVIRHDCGAEPEGGGLALLEFGGNDCDYRWEEIARDPEGSFRCNTPPEEFYREYGEAVDCLRRSGRTPVVLNLPPIHSEKYLGFLCRNGLSRENILRWLGDVEAISRWQEQYSAMTERLAREKGAPLIDLRGAFPAGGDALAELTCADGIHPSRAGQGRIYRRLCECL